MILNITAFKERPGIAIVLPTKFNFLSFFGFALIQKVATYAPCTPTGLWFGDDETPRLSVPKTSITPRSLNVVSYANVFQCHHRTIGMPTPPCNMYTIIQYPDQTF